MTAHSVNILVPLARLSDAFKEHGYSRPLPLTALLGKPLIFWILDRLQFSDEDVLWLIVARKDEVLHQIHGTVREVYADMIDSGRIKLIETHFPTRGVLETIYVCLQYMSETDLKRRTLCLNSDTLYDGSLVDTVRRLEPSMARCYLSRVDWSKMEDGDKVEWYFCDTTRTDSAERALVDCSPDCTISTVLKLAGGGQMKENRLLMVGAHAFGSAEYLRGVLVSMFRPEAKSTEFSYGFHDLVDTLRNDSAYGGIIIQDSTFFPIKTPAQLQYIISKQGAFHVQRNMVSNFAFQMYGGILSTAGIPRHHVVAAAKLLKRIGHEITISSNRGTSREAIEELLKSIHTIGIEYDHLKIEDNVTVPVVTIGTDYVDVRKDIYGELGLPKKLLHCEDTVRARHFNEVLIYDAYVMKTSSIDILQGESFYYTSIPPALETLFPKALSIKEVDGNIQLKLTRVPGTTFSQLLVNRCIRAEHLRSLLDGIRRLHTYRGEIADEDITNVDFYAAYSKKVITRFEANRELYDGFVGDSSLSIIQHMCALLDKYERCKRADVRNFIHGDPVFSNCLFTPDETVKYIDMNGKIGNKLTTKGDCAYDLAKILQSLYGYDYILLDVPVTDEDEAILSSLRLQFYEYVQLHYTEVTTSDLRLITASLYVSLIPLHENTAHQSMFWKKFLQLFSKISSQDYP